MFGQIPNVLARRKLGSSLTICLALMVLAVSLPRSRRLADFQQPDSPKQQEWKELDQRWAALIAQRGNPDSAKWTALEDDFRAFAKTRDLHLEEHASRANQDKKAADASSAFAQCPPRDDVPSYRCNLFPGPKGVCRYVCIPFRAHVRADER